MKVTYIVHNQAGTNKDIEYTVTGNKAKRVLEWVNKQREIGITILKIDEKDNA